MENIDFNKNTAVLIVSDIHLGASGAKHDDFINFLEKINSKKISGNLNHLKAIIITGDCFDLCMDSYRDLCNEDINLTIYDNLINLQNQNINVIITLGNHDIVITGNCDKKFESRKKKLIQAFLDQFTSRDKYLNFINNTSFCQYCILQTNQDNELEISLLIQKKNLRIMENLNI